MFSSDGALNPPNGLPMTGIPEPAPRLPRVLTKIMVKLRWGSVSGERSMLDRDS